MRMRCRLDSTNLKTWSRILSCLTSIGDEDIHLAFTDSTLTLTVFNASLSVSGQVTFYANFFQTFSMPRGSEKTFKLPAKCLVRPFKSMKFITKSCTFCEISFGDDDDYVLVTMGIKSLAEVRYTIQMVENADELRADYETDKLGNWIRAEAKMMTVQLNHFAHSKGVHDLTLKAEGSKILMRNCASDVVRKEGKMFTEVSLPTLAFDRFEITEEAEVTFQLRDFKAYIALAEVLKLPLTMYFQGARDPVIVKVRNDQLETVLMLATKYVEPEDSNALHGSQATTESNRISTASPASGDGQAQMKKNRPPSVLRNGDGRRRETCQVSASHLNIRDSEVNVVEPVGPELSSLSSESMRTTPSQSPPDLPTSRAETGAKNAATNKTTKQPAPLKKSNQQPEPNNKGRKASRDENENQCDGQSPPAKRLRDFIETFSQSTKSIYERFPGHAEIIVGPSDDEYEDSSLYV